MPVVAVALAATSFTAAAATFATATGMAAFAAGATMVGSALTIVGTVTGNSNLSKIGGILSIGGGLAGGWAGAADAATGAAEGAAESTAGQVVADTANTATQAVAPAAEGLTKTSGILSEGLPASQAADTASQVGQAAADVAQPASQGILNEGLAKMQATADQTAQQSIQDATDVFKSNAPVAADATATQVGQATQGNALQASGPNAFSTNDAGSDWSRGVDTAMSAGNTATDPSMISKISAWAKANPELAKMAAAGIQGVAGSLVPSPKDQAMMDAYKAQTEAMKRRAAWGAGRTTY